MSLHTNSKKTKPFKQPQVTLLTSQQYVIRSTQTNKSVIKINNIVNSEQIVYSHSCVITSCAIHGHDLIVGDVKGKIYRLKNYLINEWNNQKVTTKYQWHVHQVNGLFVDQEYLYSCGQEGTVVMWHLRENKKDFLPRIGTQILSVSVSEGIVTCKLKDNSTVTIDLTNDKQLNTYKTVINPFGFTTKSIHEHGLKAKPIIFRSSQSNTRNLLVASALPGSLQLINLNDASNHDLPILHRNLISRIDNHYPEPHDVHDVNFNKDWTLMCCSTVGINHNFLHFYKNEGYNLQYAMVSKVENPHQGPACVLSYNNLFVTYAQHQPTVKFWSRVRKAKKSIIEKEDEYFVCSGEIKYRQKPVKHCSILPDEHLLLINFQDELIFIDLKNRSLEMAFKGKNHIQQAVLAKSSKNALSVLLVTKDSVFAYNLNRSTKSLTDGKKIHSFEHSQYPTVSIHPSLAGHVAFLITYSEKQVIFSYDTNKKIIESSFQNQDLETVSVLSLCYQNGKLISFSSDCQLTNLTDDEEIFKTTASLPNHAMETQEDSGQYFENETFEKLHRNFVEKQNVRKKAQINDCLQKIQLQMYPSFGFAFTALSDKIFI